MFANWLFFFAICLRFTLPINTEKNRYSFNSLQYSERAQRSVKKPSLGTKLVQRISSAALVHSAQFPSYISNSIIMNKKNKQDRQPRNSVSCSRLEFISLTHKGELLFNAFKKEGQRLGYLIGHARCNEWLTEPFIVPPTQRSSNRIERVKKSLRQMRK